MPRTVASRSSRPKEVISEPSGLDLAEVYSRLPAWVGNLRLTDVGQAAIDGTLDLPVRPPATFATLLTGRGTAPGPT